MISNNIYLYFQNLRTNRAEYKTEDSINLNKIDSFFITITDIFINSLKNGLISINPESIQFENKHTTLFFKTALIQLKDCILFDNIDISLEFLLLLASQDKNISNHELFELKLLTKIIPLMQTDIECIQKYIGILFQFSSDTIRHRLTSELDKLISSIKSNPT